MLRKPINIAFVLTTWIVLAGYLGLYAIPAQAEGEQLYFVGMAAPIGSISQPGSTTNAVYLRWDVQEGQLPGDIGRFIIKRDDGTNIVEIFNEPADAVMSEAEINAFYAGPEQDRRLKEMMRRLDNPSNLGAAIRNKLTSSTGTDIYWRFLASRIDFNVARARYRGYLDTTATGSNAYELFAQSNEAPFPQKLVGKVTINALTTQVLPVPSSFKQVEEFSRCDVPSERFKEHGTIALNWGNPVGILPASAVDQYTASIVTGSYDLYRSTDNATDPIPSYDLRAEASVLSHDTLGEVSFTGLEKINQEPIIISGSAVKETSNEGWNPDFVQFLETRQDLLAKGIKPGDKRAYYLVARDFTGNYSETIGRLVTVPDTAAPPPPWAVRTVNEVNAPDDTADDIFLLSWDQVDVLNFYQRHKMDRTYCNLNTARFDREVRYVPKGENCDDFPHFVVDLDIKEYLVYRFDNEAVAGGFSDSDGDGYSDKAERQAHATIDNLTYPGTACDPTEPPPNPPPPDPPFTDYRAGLPVAASSAVTRSSGRRVLTFQDVIPAQAKGNVFWYRIASRDQDDNLSTLSEPIRAFFPDRTRPTREDLGVVEFGRPSCSYVIDVNEEPSAELPFALDSTEDATHVRASCMRDTPAAVPIPFEKTWEITPLESGGRGVELSPGDCRLLWDFCNDRELTVTYLANGQTLATANAGYMTTCPTEPKTELTKDCTCGPDGFVPLRPGDVTKGYVCLNADVPPDHCLNIYRDIGGKSYHYMTLCDPVAMPIELDVSAMKGNEVSLSVALQNQNNVVSSKLRLPIFTIWANDPPNPPQPMVMKFTQGTHAELSWMPPEQPVVGTIVEWYWKGGPPAPPPNAFSAFFPHADHSANDGSMNEIVTITSEQGGTDWEEQWCFRGRSVGKAADGSSEGVLSDWSALRCDTRLPEGEILPDYIPWPDIDAPSKLGMSDLNSLYLIKDQVPVVVLSDAPINGIIPNCEIDTIDTCTPSIDYCLPKYIDDVVAHNCSDFCSKLRNSIKGLLGFVAYRQTTDDTGEASAFSDYIQVSPLINTLHCGTRYSQVSDPILSELDDAYIFLVDFNTDLFNGPYLVFVDNAPHIENQYYRYQFVYFDNLGEITGYRQTDWIQAQ